MGEIIRSSSEKVLIQSGNYKGRGLIDLRIYFQSNGAWHPTRKGIAIKPNDIPELLSILEVAKDKFTSK